MSNSVKFTPSSKFTFATRQYFSSIVSNGGSISKSSLRILDNYFVKPLQSSGLWSQILYCNPCLGDQLAASLTRLIGGGSDTNHSLAESDYLESSGWQTDGSTKYIDTGVTPTQTTLGLGVYLRTTATSNTTIRSPIGANNVTFTQSFRISANRDNLGASTSGAVQGIVGAASNVSAGLTSACSTTGGMVKAFWHATRPSSTSMHLYKNGASVGAVTNSTSPSTPSSTITVFCHNVQTSGVGAFLESGSQISGYSIDSGLSVADSSTLYWIWQRFQTAMNRNV